MFSGVTSVPPPLEPIDIRLTAWMARHGVTLARRSLGIIFFWFGAIKFVPGWSPAAGIAAATVQRLTGGLIAPGHALLMLAGWEVLIGLGLLTGRALRVTLLLLFVQMLGTLLPLVLFPGETWTVFPFAPTLEGQYIIKNLVLISAAIVVGATVRGGGQLTASDEVSAAGPVGTSFGHH
jgi:uncharacterized membrane protein YkgB